MALIVSAACGGSSGTGPRGSAKRGTLTISNAFIPAPASTDVAALYFTVKNDGDAPDTLQSVTTAAAGESMFHREVIQGATERMDPIPEIVVPAHGQVTVQPGVFHVMLMDLRQALKPGGKVPVTLEFANAGIVALQVPVTTYADSASSIKSVQLTTPTAATPTPAR